MTLITSAHNERIKEVVRLQKQSAARRKSGLVVIEGLTEIDMAVRSGRSLAAFFACPELSVAADRWPAYESFEVSRPVFEKMSRREHPDGAIALIERPDGDIGALALPVEPLLVVLSGVEKPGNLGAVLRTALAAGVDAVFVASGQVDLYNPNVIRASRGAVFALPVVALEESDLLGWLKERGIGIIAAALTGSKEYHRADLAGPLALVFGTEHEGLGPEWLKAAQETVRIPMTGPLDSLNLSVSAGIVIYEARKQRSLKK